MNTLPTISAALAYVLAKETEWGLASRQFNAHAEYHTGDDSTCGCDTIRITTDENVWDVWLEEDTIYGEC